MMFPSVCVWVFNSAIDASLRLVKETGFHFIDVRPDTLDAPGALETLKSLGLKVSCVELQAGLYSTEADQLQQKLNKAHSLSAEAAYLRPCASRNQLSAFKSILAPLAGHAAEKGIKLCVEHVPGSALPTASEVMSLLRQIDHPNLYLLLDVGHALLSKEKPWEVIAAAGDRVGYVQMNDNDGKKDRHWALLDGRITSDDLKQTIEALNQAGYKGTLGLQLSPRLRVLAPEFSRNRNLLLRLQMSSEPKSMREPEARRKQ